jgi:hypothetical protein
LVLDPRTTGGTITSVAAWSIQDSSPDLSAILEPTPLQILPFADSSLAKPLVRICLAPTSLEPNSFVRFQIESTAKLREGGTAAQEPAYFLVRTATPTGTNARAPRTMALRLTRASSSLVVHGLPEGSARMTLRALDGRVLRETTSPTSSGTLTLDLRGISRGPAVVQVQQEDRTWRSLTSLF